ncbi:MAG: Gfo/Idh/MocA family oxidoreductase, partial [Cyclobacteriaceae bacterium]|nr:Gfo/Idh/MocA family oxidoreductase [Cyclobacteriaceae bacterium]
MKKNSHFSRRNFLGKIAAGSLGISVSGNIAGNLNAKQLKRSGFWESKSDKKIRIGIVGGGFGSSFFWHQHPNCIVEAVSDLQEERKRKLMEVYSCDKSYESLEKLILDDNIKAVAVFTDAPSHGRHIVEVLKHGKHCISAVPLSMTLEDLQSIKEWKEKTG